jgi:phage terminase large subunit-like protein
VLSLQDKGLTVVGFGQGFVSMAGPSKHLEELVASAGFEHGNNPVLRWQAGCCAVKQDPAGNRKPDKRSSNARIDGIVAILMALGRAMVAGAGDGGENWYTPGILRN